QPGQHHLGPGRRARALSADVHRRAGGRRGSGAARHAGGAGRPARGLRRARRCAGRGGRGRAGRAPRRRAHRRRAAGHGRCVESGGSAPDLVSALATLAPPLAATAVRALGATLRLHEEGVERLTPRWVAGQPLIYAVWHGRILMIPWLTARLRRTRGARAVRVLASRSRDGEMVTRWATRFGLSVVRGSSSRGGA